MVPPGMPTASLLPSGENVGQTTSLPTTLLGAIC